MVQATSYTTDGKQWPTKMIAKMNLEIRQSQQPYASVRIPTSAEKVSCSECFLT